MIYNKIAAGGTFDHLHIGHKTFLRWLFSQAEQVLLGITSDKFVGLTKGENIEPFEKRKNDVLNFLESHGLNKRVEIIQLDDIYGPLLNKDISVDAIGVTDDTYLGAIEINTKRTNMGLPTMPILTMALLTNNGSTISSSKVREGIIDTSGEKWVEEIWGKYTHNLPTFLRDTLKKPFGTLIHEIPKDVIGEKTITVGDITTKTFLDNGFIPHLAIVDLVVEREPKYHTIYELGFTSITNVYHLTNSAASINSVSWKMIETTFKTVSPVVIEVRGEEDLLVIPCILMSPLDFRIFYGQPHEGMVEIVVTEQTKKHAQNLMKQFVTGEL